MNVQETVAGFHLREKQDHYDYAAFFRHSQEDIVRSERR